MNKIIFILLATILISIEGFTQEIKLHDIIGTWESKEEEAEEKLIFTFSKEMNYKMASSPDDGKRIDTGVYIFEKHKQNFKLTTSTKPVGLGIEIKMNYLITFIDKNSFKLEIADPDEHGEFAELASTLTIIFTRKIKGSLLKH